MLKRSRIRPKNELQTNSTTTTTSTTTTIKPLPIVNINVSASPLLSIRKELNSVIQNKQPYSDTKSSIEITSKEQIKSTTADPPKLVPRRYDTPPPRFSKPISSHFAKISKVTKVPKLQLLKVSRLKHLYSISYSFIAI